MFFILCVKQIHCENNYSVKQLKIVLCFFKFFFFEVLTTIK